MYLTEIFLDEYYKEYSANAALTKCNQALSRRIEGKEEVEGCMGYFFYLDDTGEIQAPSEKYTELMGVWELYREVATDKDMVAMRETWIMQMFFEAGCLETMWENQNFKKNLSLQEHKNLNMLVEKLYQPISKKYLVLLRPAKGTYRVWKKVNLEHFIDGSIFDEKENVENQLMCMFRVGGIVAWVVGREGLTPQRIYGYKVSKDYCVKCSSEILEPLRETITAKNEFTKMAERNGNLAGCLCTISSRVNSKTQ